MATLRIISETKNIRASKTVGDTEINLNLQKEGEKILNDTINFNCTKVVEQPTDGSMPPPMMGMGMGLNGNYNITTEKIHIMGPFEYNKTNQDIIKEVISGCKELVTAAPSEVPAGDGK